MCGCGVLRFCRNLVCSKGSRRRRVHLAARFEPPQLGEKLQAVEIAAHAKSVIAGQTLISIRRRTLPLAWR